MNTAIKRKVMRRVYYSYTFSVVEHSMFWQGMAFGACLALFGRLTHVAALIHNFLAVPVGATPKFVVHSFTNAVGHGELFTAAVVLGMFAISVSFLVRALPMLVPHHRVVV